MQIYANLFKINEKSYFSVIFWPILILFVLSDRAWCGLQNFYSLHRILKFINYANLCKFIQNQPKNATSVFFYSILLLYSIIKYVISVQVAVPGNMLDLCQKH